MRYHVSFDYPFLVIAHITQTRSLYIIPQRQSCACHLLGFAQLQSWIDTRGCTWALLIQGWSEKPTLTEWLRSSPPLCSSQCRGWNWCSGGNHSQVLFPVKWSPRSPRSGLSSWSWKKPAVCSGDSSHSLHWCLQREPLPSGVTQPPQIPCQAGLPTLLRAVNINCRWELMPMRLELSPVRREHCYNHPAYNVSKIYRSSHCVALPISIQSKSWQRTEDYYRNDFIYFIIFKNIFVDF